MPTVNCAVIGCFNNTKKLREWKAELCETHNVFQGQCQCNRPYNLYCFPSILRNNDERKRWIHALKRINPTNSVWQPKKGDRVCSIHFVGGTPSREFPYPTLLLGYDTLVSKKPRRKLIYQQLNFYGFEKGREKESFSSLFLRRQKVLGTSLKTPVKIKAFLREVQSLFKTHINILIQPRSQGLLPLSIL